MCIYERKQNILDLETTAAQTDEAISVLEEENTQLQFTVNKLLQRVQMLEATVVALEASVNSSLQGKVSCMTPILY